MKQVEYMEKVALLNYDKYFNQGFADAGHNGPHGHIDTAVRNTAHYLIIYGFMYKKYGDKKYLDICTKFADYLCKRQAESKSGAIKCMEDGTFDHLNGLIGQGWVIEALIYFYEISNNNKYLETAKRLFYTQKYDYELHLWHRIELDGSDIGIDPTYNHQVWFAACSCKLAEYCRDNEIDRIIKDFLSEGAQRDFITYSDGLLHHSVNVKSKAMGKVKLKKLIKLFLTPFKAINPKKFELKYMEYAYHIFDIYGFIILQERYGDMPFFSSERYKNALAYALNVDEINRRCGVEKAIKEGKSFNIFSYSYNSPAFEYPYIAASLGKIDKDKFDELYGIQENLMLNKENGMFSRNNPDIDTWNARTYEIIRFCEKIQLI